MAARCRQLAGIACIDQAAGRELVGRVTLAGGQPQIAMQEGEYVGMAIFDGSSGEHGVVLWESADANLAGV